MRPLTQNIDVHMNYLIIISLHYHLTTITIPVKRVTKYTTVGVGLESQQPYNNDCRTEVSNSCSVSM